MARNEKKNRLLRTSRRDWLRSLPLGLIDLTDLPMKAPFAVIYLLGAVWAWGKRESVAALADITPLTSPALAFVMKNFFSVYLVAGAVALLVLLFYPMGRKATEDELQRVGLVNRAGEAPRLLRRRKDREYPRVTIWEFDDRGVSLQEWIDQQGRIEAALDITIIKIQYGKSKRRVLLYTVTAKNDFPDLLPWKNAYLSKQSFVLALGESPMGPVTTDLTNIPHVLLGGSTGSGKTVLLKLLLMQTLQKGAKVYIADFKGGVDYPQTWREKCKMCFDEDTLLSMLEFLVDELQTRKKLFSGKAANLDEYNNRYDTHLERYIFACDEVAEILDRTGRTKADKDRIGQVENKLATIARQGRAFGVHLILATQRPDATIIPGQIRNNIDFRVCGRADSTLSQIILDNSSAAELIPKTARGRFILHDGTVFQAYWLDEDRI